MKVTEKSIRDLAYQLWDRAGRPEGRSDEFWFAAKGACEHKTTGESEHVPHAPRHKEVRCETATDWGKRRRNPSD